MSLGTLLPNPSNMRNFYVEKPWAKFYKGSNITMHFFPDHVEYIVKLNKGVLVS